MSDTPNVLVLLATYNGQPWLQEQLDTLLAQQGCQIRILASDDQSTDDTLKMLQASASAHPNVHLLANPTRHGSAGQNFFHLIAQADVGDAQFVAFADQDDHWLPDKLQRAITVLEQLQASAYASNFWAWYPHRGDERHLVRKSQPQCEWDHLFQGPGPGCTFVLRRDHFVRLQAFVREHREALRQIIYHDWFMYAHARSHGHKWVIDASAHLLYRQHERNEIGVSRGWRAALKRLHMIRSGWLREQVLRMSEVTGQAQSWPVQALQRLTLADRIRLTVHCTQLRRGWRDRLALCAACLFLFQKSS